MNRKSSVSRTPIDNAGNLTEVVNANSSGTTLSSFSYVLDADGRRSSVTEADGSVVSYGYDWGSRLTSETRTGTDPYTITYTLDPVGNRTSQSVTSGGSTATTSFTLDNDDQLNSTSSSTGGFVNSYSYNANGEQTNRTLSGASSTLAFDYDGQLTSITTGSAVTSFAYDALGRRVSRTNGGTTTNFYLDGSKPLLEEQSGTITATYTYGTNLIRKDGEYPLFDGLGSERTVTNSSQTVTGTLVMDSFGNQVDCTGSSANPYMFAATSGYRNDWDNGLTLVGARYYDSQVGRFITRDTDLDQKPYLYCEHDPVNSVDPSGHVGVPHGGQYIGPNNRNVQWIWIHIINPTIISWKKQPVRNAIGLIAGCMISGAIAVVAVGVATTIGVPLLPAILIGGALSGAIGGAIGSLIDGSNPMEGAIIGAITGPGIGEVLLPPILKAIKKAAQ